MEKGYEASEDAKPALYGLAEQLLDNPAQLAQYDRTKWELVGHPDEERRRDGEMPWLTRPDADGRERAYTLDVFSGVSTDTNSILVVRKDRWTEPRDPATWLVMETNLMTGRTIEQTVWSARIDAARRLWLEIAPHNAANQPVWYDNGWRRHLFRNKPAYDQTRITTQLDEAWQASHVEFKDGLRGAPIRFEDIEGLEAMIIAVQRRRHAAEIERTRTLLLGAHAGYDEMLAA